MLRLWWWWWRPSLWACPETWEGASWSISIPCSPLVPWVSHWMLPVTAHHNLYRRKWLWEVRVKAGQEEKLWCLFPEEVEVGCCCHSHSSHPIMTQEGGTVWRSDTRELSVCPQWLCYLVQVCRLLWNFLFCLPYLQRIITKVRWADGVTCAHKISGPSYYVWFTDPFWAPNYLLDGRFQHSHGIKLI